MYNFLTIYVHSGICLSFKNFFLSKGGSTCHCHSLPLPLPPLDPPLIKEYFIKLAVWLVVVVGITVAMDFFYYLALVLSGICLCVFFLV